MNLLWTVRTHDQYFELSSQELFLEGDQVSKQHESKIDDSTNAHKSYSNDDDGKTNDGRSSVASIRLISSDLKTH